MRQCYADGVPDSQHLGASKPVSLAVAWGAGSLKALQSRQSSEHCNGAVSWPARLYLGEIC